MTALPMFTPFLPIETTALEAPVPNLLTSIPTEIVTLNAGVAVTSTLAIAVGTEVEHKAVIQLVRTYVTDLEEFGRVTFVMAPFQTAGGAQSREVAILNEDQATLLIAFMRNRPIVRAFKKRLVKAFRVLLDQAHDPVHRYQTMPRSEMLEMVSEMARNAAQVSREREALHLQTQRQQATISLLGPKAAFHDKVIEAGGHHSIAEAAKLLGTGQKRLFSLLRDVGVLNDFNVPFQEYLERGYFKVRERVIHQGQEGNKVHPQCFVTGKGLAWVQKQWFQKVED